MGSDSQHDWATDTDPFFIFLGIYVAVYQVIEGKLDEIILLAAGAHRREVTLNRLASMRSHQKIDTVRSIAADAERFPRIRGREGWSDRVTRVIELLDTERLRRNALLHSQYCLRGLEHGLSAFRADNNRVDGSLTHQIEEMSRARMDEILHDLAVLAFDVGQLHLQLIHWDH